MKSELLVNRRNAVMAGGAAALLGLGSARAQTTVNSVRTGGGIAGGGWMNFGPSEAQFSVFGSTFTVEGDDQPIIFGSLIWTDAAGFTLTSSRILTYGPDRDDEKARIMTGYVTRSDNDNTHAFRLRLTDAGGPGEELDMLELLVGGPVEDDAEFPELSEIDAMINVTNEITVGDVQLLTFDFGGEE
jgi:hypothetical protein